MAQAAAAMFNRGMGSSSKDNTMRGLVSFIADLRNARARELEEKRINKELANIRSKFKGGSLTGYDKKKYVCKLLYIYILGWNVDFGHLEAVNLVSANKYSEKQIGYLAVTLFLHEQHELLHLVVNSIRKDLADHNELNNCLALHAIANVGSREMGEALSADVHRLLISPTSKPFVKKKAALTLLRLFRKVPTIVQLEWRERIIAIMDDPDMGVALSVTSLVAALAQNEPEAYKGAYIKACQRLRKIVIDQEYSGNSIAQVAITTHGSDWYWTVTAIMIASTMAFVGLAATKPRQHRIFHYITAAITMVAAIAYFTMASHLGWTGIQVEFERPSDPEVRGQYREIYYVRYIDWVITTPLLLMDLLLTAGMPWPTTLFLILVDEVMIVTGLAGALVQTTYKWGYFTFGCAALLWIVYVLVWEARRHANAMGPNVGRTFLICGSLTSLLWILYPIAWAVCEGANLIAPDSEAVFYGVLDVFAKPVFGALLIWGHRNINPADLGLHIHDYNEKDVQ